MFHQSNTPIVQTSQASLERSELRLYKKVESKKAVQAVYLAISRPCQP
jgi:hypothetical protein